MALTSNDGDSDTDGLKDGEEVITGADGLWTEPWTRTATMIPCWTARKPL